MACKLRKAIGAVKDQTSISLAKVSNAANLEVNILKATTHDEIPMENRYVNEIVQLVSCNKVYAAACAQSIGKRIGKTRNWVVALKSLMLVLRIFQDGDPYFPREIFHAMKRGVKILNLSNFKDDSTTNSWDYTSFVRTFALYLDERLECFLTGKLQRRFTYHHKGIHEKNLKNSKLSNDPGIKGMKPALVLDRITHWQKLLDRAIGSRPTGSAKTNSLVKISLYVVVQESFDLYRDISDGLSVILDSFFQLPHRACVIAFNTCVKSSKQFDELSGFYALCASLGVGRTSEYPTVQKVSDELMETLREFLKDQASFSADNGQPLSPFSNSKPNLLPPLPKDPCSILGQDEAYEQSGTPKKSLEGGSEYGSQCPSLEDLMSATTDAELSPARSLEEEFSSVRCKQDEKQSQNDKFAGENKFGSASSLPIDQTSSCCDMVTFDDFQQVEQHNSQTKDQEQQSKTSSSNNGSRDCWDLVLAKIATKPEQVEQHNRQTRDQEQQNTTFGSNNGSKDCWDLVLAEMATKPEHAAPNKLSNGIGPSALDTLFDQPSSVPQPQYNPFLEDIRTTIAPSTTENYKASFANFLDLAPTFQEIGPMVSPQNPSEATIAPTFTGQSSNSETRLALTLGDLNGLTISPTFSAHDTSETKMVVGPTFPAQCLDMITAEPAFYVPGSYEIGSAATFLAHNSNETSTAPPFSTQNVNMAMTVPSTNPCPSECQ